VSVVGADRPVRPPFGRDRAIAMGIAALLMTVMVIPELNYVPLWDGRVYANCVMDAAFNGISMESLRCANHPSQGWGIWLAIPQVFAPGSVAALHLTNLALGILAIIAFRVVLARTFPDPAHARSLDLVAIAAAVHPVIMSTLLQPNVDFGVHVWFFVALAGLLSPGRSGMVIAILGGTFLVFSKETGVAAYGLAVLAALGIARAKGEIASLDQFVEKRLSRTALLGVPVALFGVHVWLWDRTHAIQAIWKHSWQETATDGFKFFDLSEPVFLSYAAGLFILGFMWVVWLPVMVDGMIGLSRIARRLPTRVVAGADTPTLIALTVMTVVLTYVLTSFRTWSNLRYFALLYPLFTMLAYAAIARLGAGEGARRGVMAVVIGLFLLASYRSVDPVSRMVYGTFDAGERRMYRMTSITGEFEGPGRDQLVYNLEFTGYHHVQNALFERISPSAESVIGTPRHVRWNIWTQLETGTNTRTMRRDRVFAPVYADEVDIAARKSPEAWFLDFSNHGDQDHSLAGLLKTYAETDSVTVFARGQKLVAHRLVRREANVVP
jgi:hypothetical protein